MTFRVLATHSQRLLAFLFAAMPWVAPFEAHSRKTRRLYLYDELFPADDGDASFPHGAPFYFYYNPRRCPALMSGVHWLCQDRGKRLNLFVASGGMGRSHSAMEQLLKDALEKCGGDYLDFFTLEYVCPYELKDNEIRDAVAQAQNWKRQGIVRHLGASTHSHHVGSALPKT